MAKNVHELTPIKLPGMTLSKAIEIVSLSANAGTTTHNQDFKNAQRLLIEAGKRELLRRQYIYQRNPELLPGEALH